MVNAGTPRLVVGLLLETAALITSGVGMVPDTAAMGAGQASGRAVMSSHLPFLRRLLYLFQVL
jgi:hypothetical protein